MNPCGCRPSDSDRISASCRWSACRVGRGKLGRMSGSTAVRQGRWAFGLTVGAFGWGLALVAAAFLAPVYSGQTSSSTGDVAKTSSTLVGQNGLWVIVPAAVPAALALLVWFGLQRKCSRGSRLGTYLAWGAVVVLAVFAVVAAASIGLFVLPAVLLLAAAAAMTPTR